MGTVPDAGKAVTHTLLLIKPKMPLKLTYFDLRARAEPTRLILAQAGVEFEDERLPAPWDDMAPWTAMKPTTPFGVLPILCVDGTKICQSMTIARYCGHAYGLGGKNAMENAQMDEIVDAVSDFTEKQYNAFLFEKDEAKKAELQKTYTTETGPTFLKQLEARLCSRGGEYFVGGKLSYADIIVYNFCSELPCKQALASHPKLNALVDKVANLPNIKKWVESRPATVC